MWIVCNGSHGTVHDIRAYSSNSCCHFCIRVHSERRGEDPSMCGWGCFDVPTQSSSDELRSDREKEIETTLFQGLTHPSASNVPLLAPGYLAGQPSLASCTRRASESTYSVCTYHTRNKSTEVARPDRETRILPKPVNNRIIEPGFYVYHLPIHVAVDTK